MKLWLDTEFNGFGGSLISMALVDEAGRAWYEVLECRSPCSWVAQNVMPKLMKQSVTRTMMQDSLSQFLGGYDDCTIKADYPEDLKHLCDLLIVSPGMFLCVPPLTMVLATHLNAAGSSLPHNALADAIALRQCEMDLLAQKG